ncbi:hypothetical protein [Collimonas humicola]|uniref:hypothetical protein n=1 Tax=Collimonas humicola TaxID=2825886 RepID=UPI001B8B466C|nr:hypothetical protein [Collimonas humicola]
MSEFTKVSTLAEVAMLDKDEMMLGYWHGFEGNDEPGSDKSKSFWHGYRNGRVDGGFAEPDLAQKQLAHEINPRREGAFH